MRGGAASWPSFGGRGGVRRRAGMQSRGVRGVGRSDWAPRPRGATAHRTLDTRTVSRVSSPHTCRPWPRARGKNSFFMIGEEKPMLLLIVFRTSQHTTHKVSWRTRMLGLPSAALLPARYRMHTMHAADQAHPCGCARLWGYHASQWYPAPPHTTGNCDRHPAACDTQLLALAAKVGC